MTDRILPWTASALAALLFAAAVALGDQLEGVGGGYWSGGLAAGTSSAPVLNQSDAGAAGYALFPAGNRELMRMVQIEVGGAARFGFAATPTAAIGALNAWEGGGCCGVGPGNVRSFTANGGEWHTRPKWEAVRSGPGGALGICDVPLENYSGEPRIYVPCNRTANCTDIVGSGVCILPTTRWTPPGTNRAITGFSDDQTALVGLFGIGESNGGTVGIGLHKEVVAK